MRRDMRDVAQILPVGRIGCRVRSRPSLAAMPDACDQNVPRLGNHSVAYDIAGGTEPDHDLPDVAVIRPTAPVRKVLETFDSGENQRHGTLRRARTCLIEKGP